MDNNELDILSSLKNENPTPDLKEALLTVQIEWPKDENKYFVPINIIRALKTAKPTVKRTLQDIYPDLTDDDIELTKCIEWSCTLAPRLFTSLLCAPNDDCKRAIRQLAKDRITDHDLPFGRETVLDRKHHILWGRTHRNCPRSDHYQCRIKAISEWGRVLDGHQWVVQAPEFRAIDGQIPHQEFHLNVVMPFVEDDEKNPKSGGFGHVWGIRIHPAHQNLLPSTDSRGPRLAVKRLFSQERIEFDKESNFLRDITKLHDKHLVRLLATYKHKGNYHLIFPYAKANLRDYWNKIPLPHWNIETCTWVLEQIHGLVSALNVVHNFNTNGVLQPDEPNQTALTTVSRFAKKFVVDQSEKYGRHGDLKPENILWLDEGEGISPGGIFQIADFGLGRFHGLESRSRQNPRGLSGSPTYSPPEIALEKPVSRAYDMWSMGCIILEFITWLVKGSAGFEKFDKMRMDLNQGVYDDLYYKVKSSAGAIPFAVVRRGVSDWIDELRKAPRCSGMVLEYLAIVENKLLRIETGDRIRVKDLVFKTRQILAKGLDDMTYLLGADATIINEYFGKGIMPFPEE